MQVSPINNAYVMYAKSIKKRNDKPETATVSTESNVSFKSITKYQECFNKAIEFSISSKRDMDLVFRRLCDTLRDVAYIRDDRFKTSFTETMGKINKRYESWQAGVNKEYILANKIGTGDVLAYMNPAEEFITFVPPGVLRRTDMNNMRPINGPYITFSKVNNGFSIAKPNNYIEIWEKTGNIKEEIDYYNDNVVRHVYYKEDGSEDGWKNFIYGK